jgi:hypothetical protein
MQKTVQLPQFGRDAEVRAESFDQDANTIDIVWTTGATVRRYDYWDGTEYDEVLSVEPGAVRLERLNRGAPFLDAHCSYALASVIGSVVPGTAKIADGQGTATIRLSKAEGVADTVQKIREGVICNVSVGYWVHKVVKTEGERDTVDRWDVVDWEPLEISAVPIPADPGSQIRSEQQGEQPQTCSCVVMTKTSAAVPNSKPSKGKRMASKVKAPAKRKAELSAAEQEAEKKRLAELRAAKRDDDKDDKKDDDGADDERDEDTEEDDADAERDGDESDTKDDADDDDGEGGKNEDDDDDDGKRAAPAVSAKSGGLSAADIRKAAEAAVRADRIRGAKIREIAAQFGFPKLGERHANGETSVRAFKDFVLERLAERQKKRGNTTFAAAGTPEVDDGPMGVRQAPTAQAREMEKGAAEARALLGIK